MLDRSQNAQREVLEVEDLRVSVEAGHLEVRAVDGLSLSVRAGEMLGVVGESGCGKSMTARSILRLFPSRAVRVKSGHIRFEGRDLLTLSEKEMRLVRGNRISMIFQEPMTSLNPVFSIGSQLAEAIRLHAGLSRAEVREKAVEMLRLVQIPHPERLLGAYPAQLSGGMRQRVMIAMALSCDPQVLIADEPTTALDVTIQAQILALLADLKTRLGTAIIMITHDLGVIAETCDRVVVMYAGRKVEEARVEDLFANPLHPYTRGLLASLPRLGREGKTRRTRLSEIPGSVPSMTQEITGCAFFSRCALASAQCRASPPLREMGAGQQVACWRAEG